MKSEPAIDKEANPYGAWYTRPGGTIYDTGYSFEEGVQRAQSKLASIRSGANEPRFRRDWAQGLAMAVIGFMQLGYAGLLSSPWLRLGNRPWDTIDTLKLIFFVGIGAGMLIFAFVRMLRPSTRTPERAFRRYLSGAVGSGRLFAYALGLDADKKESWLRRVDPMLDDAVPMTEPVSFISTSTFERYWIHAFGGSLQPLKLTRHKNLRLVELASDLVVVESELRISKHSLVGALMSVMPGIIGGGITAVIVVFVLLGGPSTPAMAFLAAAPAIIGAIISTLMALSAFVPRERKSLAVRKLVVRVNGQWRILNSELQGAEEADVSWALNLPEG